jgi:hypothetical protein
MNTENIRKTPKIRKAEAEHRQAVRKLQIALIEASLRFERHQDFTAWLVANNCECIESYDPIRGRDEQVSAIWDLKRRVSDIDDIVDALSARNPTLLREPLACLAACALRYTDPKLRRGQRAQYRNAFVLLIESLSQRIADNPAEQEAGDD